MPNRIIRDALLESERYHELSSNDARLLFIELLLLADDYGLVPVGALFLSRRTSAVAGGNAAAITRLLTELSDFDLIRVYQDGRQQYAYIPRFGNRPQAIRPKWPLPPESVCGNEIREAMGRSKWKARSDRITNQQLSGEQHGCNSIATSAQSPETETETETETEKKEKRPRRGRVSVGLEMLLKAGVDERVAEDWLAIRKVKRLPLTETGMNAVVVEAAAAKLSVPDAIKAAVEHGWAGFKARWLEAEALDRNGQPPAGDTTVVGERAARASQDYLKTLTRTPEQIAKAEEARKAAMSLLKRPVT